MECPCCGIRTQFIKCTVWPCNEQLKQLYFLNFFFRNCSFTPLLSDANFDHHRLFFNFKRSFKNTHHSLYETQSLEPCSNNLLRKAAMVDGDCE